MANVYRLFVGANNKTGKCELTKLKGILDKNFQGYTVIKSQGRWEGKDEPSVIVEISTDESQKIETLVIQICKELGQAAVGVQVLPPIAFIAA